MVPQTHGEDQVKHEHDPVPIRGGVQRGEAAPDSEGGFFFACLLTLLFLLRTEFHRVWRGSLLPSLGKHTDRQRKREMHARTAQISLCFRGSRQGRAQAQSESTLQ